MKRLTISIYLCFSLICVSAGPKFADTDGFIIDQAITQNVMHLTIGDHVITIKLADYSDQNSSDWNFDKVMVDDVLVFKRTTDMIPSGMGVSLFRCDFYLLPNAVLPNDLRLVVGLAYNNGIWYLQYCFYLNNNEDEFYIFMLPERDKDWNYIYDNREIYYFHEKQVY